MSDEGRAKRRHQVLEAATEYLSSSALDIDRLLTYDRLEELSGIDRAQIAKDFGSKSKLIDDLVDFALISPSNPEAAFDEELREELLRLADASPSPSRLFARIAEVSDNLIRNDPSFRIQLAVWSLSHQNTAAQDRLALMYEQIGRGAEDVTDHYVSLFESQGFEMPKDLNNRELSVLFTAIGEGLAIRAAVDPDSVPDGLTAKAFTLITQGVILDSGNDAVGDALDDLHG